MNLFDYLRGQFPLDRERGVVVNPDGDQLSYRWLGERSAVFADAMEREAVAESSVVAVQVDKCPDFLALYLAILRSGRVFLPLNPTYTAAEVEYFLKDAHVGLLVCQPERAAEMQGVVKRAGNAHLLSLGTRGDGTLAEGAGRAIAQDRSPAGGGLVKDESSSASSNAAAPRDDDQPAVLLYTSGTTGKPKGAMLSHGNVRAMIDGLHESWGWRSDDVLLHALPLFHIHGLFVAATTALRAGATMILLPRFDAEVVLEYLPRSTVFMGVPTMYHRLAREERMTRERCSRIRLFACGSAPLSVPDFAAFQERSGCTILERYGMTETGMLTSNPLVGVRKPGSVGIPMPGVEVMLADQATLNLAAEGEVGEIWVRGPNVFTGYLDRPEANEDAFVDGWFRTGDLGRRDADGYYSIVGRARDLVISGGLNVYPAEVEWVLDSVEGVEESAIIGLPDDDLGERVTAVIVRSHPEVSAAAITQAARAQLAPYKCPRQIEFVSSLPRNAMGKVDKAQLRRSFEKI
ncbi:MAG TPA: AMP-binding protein [Chloroflexota bacterium]